jgi:hypothetical protein
MSDAEKYLTPKELVGVLADRYNIRTSESYVCLVRKAHAARPEQNIFARGMAKASDLIEWLKRNPDFKPRKRSKSGLRVMTF